MKRHLMTLASVFLLTACATANDQMGSDDGMAMSMDDSPTIVEIAAGDDRFTTLVTAVQEAGLVDTLNGDGPFTVFAPTDDAFAQLPEGTVASLLEPENRQQLVDILTYHVVPGQVMAADIAGRSLEAETVNGTPLPIDARGAEVEVGGATVIATDIMASNGVIHVVDAVILPE